MQINDKYTIIWPIIIVNSIQINTSNKQDVMISVWNMKFKMHMIKPTKLTEENKKLNHPSFDLNGTPTINQKMLFYIKKHLNKLFIY